MTLETFFKKFDQFADAPDAVVKMRELVLGLAISGKLVEQKETEGDGWELLDQILAKRQNAKPIDPGAKYSNLVGLPSNWAETHLGIVADIIRGVTFPGSAKSMTKRAGDVACLRTASVQAEIDWDDLIFISPSHVKRVDQWVAKNDIIISMANSFALVGKVAVVRKIPQKATFGGFLAAIRPILIEPYYLLYVLRSPWMQAAFRASSSQTTNIANISLGGMRPLAFPLPPLAEQKRIVAKVDELMALCDRLEAQQQGRYTRHVDLARASLARFADAPTPANLHFLFHKCYDITPADLRKSILTLAVQGKLVPQDQKEGSGNELLTQLQARRQKKGSMPKRSKDGSLPFSVPSSWAIAGLGEIYDSSFYGPRFGKEEYVKEGGIPTIRTTDMTTKGQIVLRDPPRISIDDPKKLELYAVRANDLLVTRSGTIGMMAVFKGDYAAIPSAYLIRFRFPPEVTADFYYLYLSSPHGHELLGLSLRSIGVPNVNATSISMFTAPIPPLDYFGHTEPPISVHSDPPCPRKSKGLS